MYCKVLKHRLVWACRIALAVIALLLLLLMLPLLGAEAPLTITFYTLLEDPYEVLLTPGGEIPWYDIPVPDRCTNDFFDMSRAYYSYETDHFIWWFSDSGDLGVDKKSRLEFANEELFYTYLQSEMPQIAGKWFFVGEIRRVESQNKTHAVVIRGCTLSQIK